ARLRGGMTAAAGAALAAAFATYNPADPSLNAAGLAKATNALGAPGAVLADAGVQSLGLACAFVAIAMVVLGLARVTAAEPDRSRPVLRLRALAATLGVLTLAGALAGPRAPAAWPLAKGLGGLWGDALLSGTAHLLRLAHAPMARGLGAGLLGLIAAAALVWSLGLQKLDYLGYFQWIREKLDRPAPITLPERAPQVARRQPRRAAAAPDISATEAAPEPLDPAPLKVKPPKTPPKQSAREEREAQIAFDFARPGGFRLPELSMLAKPKPRAAAFDEGALRQNAQLLESVLAEFGVRGQVDQIRPGPVVTLYELVPAAGVKSARVVALADDIARSMSVAACRVSVVPGRNAIGIELPNQKRETVYLRDLLAAHEYERGGQVLPVALGETIGGEPYIADLAKMPHLLIAGTTGSGKSVGVNAMILSILYRLPPEQCRLIMVDPKMLELSVYDGIPHLLAPVVTDPKKAIVALKWTVREMEDRYRRMSKIGVRNIASYNERAREAAAKGEHFERTVQTGFDEAGRPIFESEKINPEPMPYLVVIIDEVADLMMVAGKDIEGAVQRLAQMARAAGIHLIMATQRPSVDVITGTIKANFPTRISFQVTSKIDSRTILGEQGAEQL
ncbi:MAG: DNA translocase FtsK 4TM domain-containing protein, partial [Alphaproteobacteria bacterium]|nr:DNA translocase FtsK 4TM domain-containing protein [Alphaproteobacteria bacterium]